MKTLILIMMLIASNVANAASVNEYLATSENGQLNYMMGLADGILAISNRVCVDKGITYAQAIQIFINYANANPTRWNEEVYVLFMDSMMAAYPCGNREVPKASKAKETRF
jgi:hypothetical protein